MNFPAPDHLQLALDHARQAAAAGEVPVGAVIVKDGQVIAIGRNSPIASHDPSAHAEMNALRQAAKKLGNYRLEGCELLVTLEPCAMCAGAILNARISRVVYGAKEPKTGAAGSVLNLFTGLLNHQTEIQYATDLGAACALFTSNSSQLLQDFFAQKRVLQAENAKNAHPLRPDALRTPDERFTNLPNYPFKPNYISDLPSLNGLRLHYLDEGKPDANITYLCLHGNPAWSYLYRKMIPIFAQSGARVIAPDMIGFGRSDKPKKDGLHSFVWHRQCLLELIERLDLKNIVLVVQDWGGILGLTLPLSKPERYIGLLAMNTMLATGDASLTEGFKAWRDMCAKKPDFDVARLFARGNPQLSEAECQAYNAPFPDSGHRAATRAFPKLVPEFESDQGSTISRQACNFWQHQWSGKTLIAIGEQDPVLGTAVMQSLAQTIRGEKEIMRLPQAGHFVQEQGEAIARRAIQKFAQRAVQMFSH